ncbi:MAG: 50S ribosomal protein L15 [Clostridiales bacterium]|nr:50S ribosomal protein L15 [Candidatus Apopatousia equi]
MELSKLSPAPNSKKARRRLGRGTGSGLGKTSGKGQKGQNSRSGGGVRPGFEGGQMPLLRRLPKMGFTNHFRKVYSVINVSDLERYENGTVVDAELLKKDKLIGKVEANGLKVLGNGNLTKNLVVKASKFTESAVNKIKAAGGSIEVL